MKKIFIFILPYISSLALTQVTIGKNNTPANDYVSIEFGAASSTENKGIILPWVTNESAVSNAPVGTLIFDAETQKVKLATSNTPTTPSLPTTTQSKWLDLSNGATTPTTFSSNPTTPLGESSNAKVIIGASTSQVEGILILETPTPDINPRAMILPRVQNYSDIVNPSAGMIVYLTTKKLFAVFNGKEWSFWKP